MPRRSLLVLALVVGAVLGLAGPASAHPTDEVVQQLYLTPARSGLTVQLDLTPGTLVARAFVRSLDTDGNGTLDAAETAAHAAAVGSALAVAVDGHPAALTPTAPRYPPANLLAAAGATITLGWTAPLPADAREVTVTDRYPTPGRPAVQMSVLVPPDPVGLGPVRHLDGGATLAVALDPAAPPPAAQPPTRAVTMLDALRRPLTSPAALAVLLGACALLGALHALTPGHGKALLASYLVGGRGTPGQALGLGVVLTATHTAAVVALGVVVLAAGQLSGTAVPALTAAAGLVVLGLGLRLVRQRWRPATGHGHGHVTRRGLLAMGLSAGLVPCPEALSVLLLAVGLHRTALGLVMIVAFGAGLAAVLVGLGLLLVTAAPALARAGERVPRRLVARLPLCSAVVVAVLGGAMAVTGVSGLLA